ncbi:hypothetical protein PP707_04085 [Acetobacter pasteurianus]|nr:hypothetical protein [Acetobacter pasteurianus]
MNEQPPPPPLAPLAPISSVHGGRERIENNRKNLKINKKIEEKGKILHNRVMFHTPKSFDHNTPHES